MYIPTIILTFNPLKTKGVTQWLNWYGLFFIFYIAIFGMKYNWKDWNKAAAISLFALFLGGEWWELGAFVYDYLGKMGLLQNRWTGGIMDLGWIFSHIRRVYTLAACVLLGTIAKVKITHIGWMFLGAGTIICFILLLPIGLGIRTSPLAYREMARITALSFTGIIILEGLDAP